MKVAFAEQMREIDRRAQVEYGLSGDLLMERAGLSVREIIGSLFNPVGKRIIIFCGKGNNGGDGLALARLLTETGAIVTGVLVADRRQYQGLALENLERAAKFQVRLVEWPELHKWELDQADLIVDGLLGTGAHGAPSGVFAAAIDAINQSTAPVLALDIPSGIDVNTGGLPGAAVKADYTVTFGLPKPGLFLYPGADYAGRLFIEPIGFPVQLTESGDLQVNWLNSKEVAQLLPKRPATAHKGSAGQVLVIGGSSGMTGAVALATTGALKAGAGLVTAGLRMDLNFPEKPMEVIAATWPEIAAQLGKYRSIVFGPGLSTVEDGYSLLQNLAKNTEAPLVIDADGLNIIASYGIDFGDFNGPVILTPHPGEMARLTGLDVTTIQSDRLGIARRFAVEWGVIIVLKGARTIIADPQGETFINLTGNPGMATAGMGDVLAGIIGGLLAQGLKPLEAATVGVFLHGKAADSAAETGMIGLMAHEVCEHLPITIKKVCLNEQV